MKKSTTKVRGTRKDYCKKCGNTGKCQVCDGFGCMTCDYSGNCKHCSGTSAAVGVSGLSDNQPENSPAVAPTKRG